MSNTIDLSDVNFDNEVKRSTVPVLVDFFASWCGPCQQQHPIIDQVADELSGRVRVGKINVEEGKIKAAEYAVTSIPTLLVFKDGEVIEKLAGLHTKSQLENILGKYI